MEEEVDILAKKIWDYHHLNQELEKADCLLVLGSHDERVAAYAGRLFLKGWVPLLIFSGGLGRLTEGLWDKPESDTFAEIAIDLGVPKDRIIIENQSANTGENIIFTKKLLEEKGHNFQKFIVVHKPYMERRAYLTFKKNWSEKEVIVTSPPISFEEYPDHLRSKEDVINIMVGDLQRIKLYGELGFQIPQKIPQDVWAAYEKLVSLGYTKQLVPSQSADFVS